MCVCVGRGQCWNTLTHTHTHKHSQYPSCGYASRHNYTDVVKGYCVCVNRESNHAEQLGAHTVDEITECVKQCGVIY